MTGWSRIIFYSAVFLTFDCLGFLNLLSRPARQPAWWILVAILGSGVFAIFYAWAGVTRRWWLLGVVWIVQALMFTVLGSHVHETALLDPHSEAQRQLNILTVGAKLTLVLGYALFLTFFGREGARYFRSYAEIQLAREIHRALVPTIERTVSGYSLYGASLPSGEVGGDLVDLVMNGEHPATWTAYVADVSGHGVTAGVLMAMFKTAVRTTVVADGSANSLLNEVHRALYPLKTPNLFVTAGVLHCDNQNRISLSLAGHPPLLHYRRQEGDIVEHVSEDMPLGILPEQKFCTREIAVKPGDILALLTDGLTEVFDPKKNELGLEPIKTALQRNADSPLPELFDAIRRVAISFGKQDDDQTLLLVRAS